MIDVQPDMPGKPKYQLLAEAIIEQIENGTYGINEKIPSVNKIAQKLNYSRETVFKALNHLSERGIIRSSNRKGYYVQRTDTQTAVRVFALFDKITYFKQKIFYGLQEGLKGFGTAEAYFHHHNPKVLASFIRENLGNYTHFCVVTFFKSDVSETLNLIPPHKRIILDNFEPHLEGEYSAVFQDFAYDLETSLKKAIDRLNQYQRLILVAHPELYRYHSDAIITGFNNFKKVFEKEAIIIDEFETGLLAPGDVYILLRSDDQDLVEIIKHCRKVGYEIGKDIGIISYNNTLTKEVLEGGITVISTDFEAMGRRAAQIILGRETVRERNPTRIIFRKSL